MRIPKNGMLFMIIVIIVMTGIMIIANTNYQYRATLFNSQLLYCVVLCCESEVSQWLPDFVVGYHGEEGPSVNLHVQTDHVACLEQTYSE